MRVRDQMERSLADEPDDLTPRLLRDIGTRLEDLDVLRERMEALDRRFDDFHGTVYGATGFATHAHVRGEATESRVDDREARPAKLEEKA